MTVCVLNRLALAGTQQPQFVQGPPGTVVTESWFPGCVRIDKPIIPYKQSSNNLLTLLYTTIAKLH